MDLRVPRGSAVLAGIDLDIRRGETVAVVGMSGAGKTTLSALLPRFYDVNAGSITLDGVDIRKMTLDVAPAPDRHRDPAHVSLQRQRAEQHFLWRPFQGHGRRHHAPPRRRHAHDFITELPAGYDTDRRRDGVHALRRTSGSGSPSPARCSRTHPSLFLTRRPRRWTPSRSGWFRSALEANSCRTARAW